MALMGGDVEKWVYKVMLLSLVDGSNGCISAASRFMGFRGIGLDFGLLPKAHEKPENITYRQLGIQNI
jgi:hypothetical protein